MKDKMSPVWITATALLLSACSGGSGGSEAGGPPPAQAPDPAPTKPPPPANQSPGGIWGGFTEAGDSTFYITETGELRFSADIPGGILILGAGSVQVSGGDQLAGELAAARVLPESSASPPPELSCGLEGTLTEHVQLELAIDCEDANGPTWNETLNLSWSPDYGESSSLDRAAGGYRLAFRPAAEILSLDAGGEISGMYHNGLNCTVNAQVSPLDPSYNLYWVEWTMSNCQGPFPNYEGVEFTGIASIVPVVLDEAPAGSLHLFLTAEVHDSLDFLSVVYEPA